MSKPRDIRKALFTALEAGGMLSKDLSKASGISEVRISNFKNNKNINFDTLQRLIEALPPEIYDSYLLLLSGKKLPVKSDERIAQELLAIAHQLKRNRIANKQNKKISSSNK